MEEKDIHLVDLIKSGYSIFLSDHIKIEEWESGVYTIYIYEETKPSDTKVYISHDDYTDLNEALIAAAIIDSNKKMREDAVSEAQKRNSKQKGKS